MLTPTDIKNIENFQRLNKNHQRVFRYRIKNKSKKSIKDLNYLLLNYNKLKLKIEDFIDPDYLISLVDTIKELEALQNM